MAAGRFLRLSEVSEILNISEAQTYALVRCGDLPAIKIGGRGQWRVEREQLESYIERMYRETQQFVAANPLGTAPPTRAAEHAVAARATTQQRRSSPAKAGRQAARGR